MPGGAGGRAEGWLSRPAGRRSVAGAAGLIAVLAVGGVAGVAVGVVACVAVDLLLARRTPASVAGERVATARDLPLALDLMSCVLSAGQPPAAAAAAVAAALRGPVGLALGNVGHAWSLGAPAELALEPLARLTGAAAAARTLARAASNGIALADELRRTADDLRAAHAAAVDARIRRSGVLVVLPLGLCFLPAFVCVGVIPLLVGTVAGVAGPVLR